MEDLSLYPIRYRKNIRKLMLMLSADAERVFSLLKMNALLMDLDMDDSRVVDAILMDCGIDDEFTEVRA